MQRVDARRIGVFLAVSIPSLAAATLVVGFLQDVLGVPNPSAVYLVAVVATALVSGTFGAIFASVASFLLYNFLYTAPRFTFSIAEPSVWLGVVLLLFVGIVVGQLAAVQRSRTEVAQAREREARALFQLTRAMATRESTVSVLTDLVAIIAAAAGFDRVWVAFGADDAGERTAADSDSGPAPVTTGLVHVLRRMPGDTPAEWIRVRPPTARPRQSSSVDAYRVRVEAGGTSLGSIWAARTRGHGLPDRTATRLVAAAADQIGQALAHDRLAVESQAAEIARQSDALKSALLQSVSHDLRTPLATIRAAAGTLRPGTDLSVADQQASADAIDREVEYLNRLVTNLLDLSRIEAGALRAERDIFELDDLVGQTIARLRDRLEGHPVDARLDAVPVRVDPIFLDAAVTNILENSLKYTPAATPIRLIAMEPEAGRIRLTIEDGGPGVPPEALGKLFDKFYRVPGQAQGSRSGTGIGLAVVRGLTEAMDGHVRARRSELGGLAIDLDLPAAGAAAEVATGDGT